VACVTEQSACLPVALTHSVCEAIFQVEAVTILLLQSHQVCQWNAATVLDNLCASPDVCQWLLLRPAAQVRHPSPEHSRLKRRSPCRQRRERAPH